jgi:hypothetical protein
MTSQASVGIDGSGDLLCVKWPFVARTWLIDEEQLRSHGLAPGTDPRAWLLAKGVTFPVGSMAVISPAETNGRRGLRLAVRNSEENLQRVALLFDGNHADHTRAGR